MSIRTILTPRQRDCCRVFDTLRRSRIVKPRERVGLIAAALAINQRTVRVHLDKARDKGWR